MSSKPENLKISSFSMAVAETFRDLSEQKTISDSGTKLMFVKVDRFLEYKAQLFIGNKLIAEIELANDAEYKELYDRPVFQTFQEVAEQYTADPSATEYRTYERQEPRYYKIGFYEDETKFVVTIRFFRKN